MKDNNLNQKNTNQLEKPTVDAQGALASINARMNAHNDRLEHYISELMQIGVNAGVVLPEDHAAKRQEKRPVEFNTGILALIYEGVNQYENLLDRLEELTRDFNKL